MIRASFNGSDRRVVQLIKARGPAIVEQLVREINAQAIKLQSYIVTQKLSGQVLAHRSGKLASSVRVVLAKLTGAKRIEAEVLAGGGPAFYARLHEYGGKSFYQIVPKAKKALYWTSGGEKHFAKSVNHPPMPKRSFMMTSIRERASSIIAALRAAVQRAKG